MAQDDEGVLPAAAGTAPGGGAPPRRRKGRARSRKDPKWCRRRPGSDEWQMDFAIPGVGRVRRSTGTTDPALAEEIATAERDRLLRVMHGIQPAQKPRITMSQATGTWYDRVGQWTPWGKRTAFYMLPRFIGQWGGSFDLARLNDEEVAGYVRGRRQAVSNRTINVETQLLARSAPGLPRRATRSAHGTAPGTGCRRAAVGRSSLTTSRPGSSWPPPSPTSEARCCWPC